MRFPVYETRVAPRSVVFLVHADPATLEAKFDDLRTDLWRRFYVPQLRRVHGEYLVEIIRRPPARPWGSWTNLLLLGLTIASTVAAGGFLWLAWRGGLTLQASDFLDGGLYFSLPLMTILGVHELGHFVVARRHRVEASLPYFIPVPPPFLLFGTFGAFISLREPIPTKKALLDIGAAGPLAGLLVAIPVALLGLHLSATAPPLPATYCGPTIGGFSYGGLNYGASGFWALLGLFVPTSAIAHLHPLALAGWVGFLVTAINLLPAGQLDGGHVFRALLGDRSRFVSYAAVAGLFVLGIEYSGWIVFALLVFFLGMRHPPPLNDITPLDAKRWVVGALAVAILLGGFVVVPISTAPAGAYGIGQGPILQSGAPSGYAMADNVTLSITNHDTVGHVYEISASITAVYALVNGISQPLNGTALAAFEANSTWVLTRSNGSTSTFGPAASFAVGAVHGLVVGAGSTEVVHLLYLNTHQGAVEVRVSASEFCNAASTSRSVSFTVS